MGLLFSRLSLLSGHLVFAVAMFTSTIATAQSTGTDASSDPAPFYKATQDLLARQEQLAAELDAIAESMIKATSNDSPARRALAAAKQNFDSASTAFRNNPDNRNRDALESARKQLLKATSEFSDIDIDVSALRQRQNEAQSALDDIDSELARLQKTLNGIRVASEQADQVDRAGPAASSKQQSTAAESATAKQQVARASGAANNRTVSKAGTAKRVYPSNAKPVIIGPNFTMLVTPDQVSEFRADIKRQTRGQSSRSRRTFRVVTVRSNGQELIQDYAMDGLGAGFYISKLKLRSGQNRFLVGGQSWQFKVLPSEENKGYMLLLDTSNRPASVTLYPVALAR